MNVSLKIGVLNTPPMSTRCALDAVCPQRGFAVDAALTVCRLFNINCTFEWFGSDEYGDGGEGGNATGMVRAIKLGLYDTSLPVFTPTYRRYQALDFSQAYFSFDSVLITRAPFPKLSYGVNWGIANGFQAGVWCALVVLFFACSALFTFLLRKFTFHSEVQGEHLVAAYLRVSMSLITNDYEHRHLTILPVRLVSGAWLLAAVVVTGLYTGMLFSNKLVQERNLPFTDLETFVECLELGECRLVSHTESISYILQLRKGGGEFSTRVDSSLMRNPIVIVELDKIPQAILDEKRYYLVWHWPKDWFYYSTKGNDICKYYTMDTPFVDVEAFPVRKNYTFLPLMNKIADVFREQALDYAIRQKYFRPTVCNEQTYGKPAGEKETWLHLFGTIFYFYSIGMALAAVVMIIELAVNRIKARSL